MDDYEKKITIITVIIAILALILATLMIITIGEATKTAVSQAYNLNCLTENVLSSLISPFGCSFSHYRRRSDREDSGNITVSIGSMRCSVVTIHGFHFSCHKNSS